MSWFVCLLASICVQTATGTPTSRLMLVGTIGPHSYFYDNLARDWRASGAFCKSLGMKLADLPSESHLQLLDNYSKANPQQLPKGQLYWTSGRDWMTLAQFAWNNTGSGVQTSLRYGGSDTLQPFKCLAYSMQLHLQSWTCSKRLGVICET